MAKLTTKQRNAIPQKEFAHKEKFFSYQEDYYGEHFYIVVPVKQIERLNY